MSSSQKTHIELGHDLQLFFFDPVSPGSCFFLPHGATVHRKLIEYLRKYYRKAGYREVVSPNIFDKKLWITSGHWDKYRKNMFLIKKNSEIRREEGDQKDEEDNSDEMEFSLKAMNCPSHCVIFNQMNISHKQLPLRMADFGVLHRNELSGALRGLTRVRRFQQDDAHIFCHLEQVEEEIKNLLEFIDQLYTGLGFKYGIEVSTRPEGSFIGELETWNQAEEILKRVVSGVTGKDPVINAGDGAFYGPKIDISLQDSLGRWQQCGTIQLDFNLPERFDLKYLDQENELQRPIMIHRALFGSLERFMAIVLEHTNGKLPFWMSPRQVLVLPINPEKHGSYARGVMDQLIDMGFEVEINDSNDDLRQKIKEGERLRFNYMLVIGDKEVDGQVVAVRERDVRGIKVMKLNEFGVKLHSL